MDKLPFGPLDGYNCIILMYNILYELTYTSIHSVSKQTNGLSDAGTEIFQFQVSYCHQVVSLNLYHQSRTKGRWEIKYGEILSTLHMYHFMYHHIPNTECIYGVFTHICKFIPQLRKM